MPGLSLDGELTPALDIVVESPLWQALPQAAAIVRRAIALAARSEAGRRCRAEAAIAVLLCDDAAIARLNARWRGTDRPTNVLSFPAPGRRSAAGPASSVLGDIAIAYETVAREAEAQGKPCSDHLAHLAVHGFLHLLGYDHHDDIEAERMERLERDILAQLGIADPYADDAEV